ncbi:uncharacterized protein LOC126679587 [Mercurialis annua]|uniref:uncharacterized protein LOC126679587 n=1 Tax=Mercurialis annua TaxID=3986 RepID=UPI002160952E|nr:uncharacterized protein LOC126679587 [Mercurialis annua]
MDTMVDLKFNYGGTWIHNPELQYVNGDVDVLCDFDIDFLSYRGVFLRYQNFLGFKSVERIFILEPGKRLGDGLFLIEDDDSIRQVLNHMRRNSRVGEVEFYADNDVDIPHLVPEILTIQAPPADIHADSGNVGHYSGDGGWVSQRSQCLTTERVIRRNHHQTTKQPTKRNTGSGSRSRSRSGSSVLTCNDGANSETVSHWSQDSDKVSPRNRHVGKGLLIRRDCHQIQKQSDKTSSSGSSANSGSSTMSRKAEAILNMLSSGGGSSEVQIRRALGDTPDTSKALRMLLKEKEVKRSGTGGRLAPFIYMIV